MVSNRVSLAALAVACVAAAGVGGYFATRHSQAVNEPAAAATLPPAASPPSTNPVHQPEAALAPAAPVTSPPPAAPAASAIARTTGAARATGRQPINAASPRPAEPPSAERSAREGVQAAPSASLPAPVAEAPAPAAAQARSEEPTAEPSRAAEPPPARFEELVVSADSVIGLQTDTAISSARARVEDKVEAHVVRGVRVGGSTAIPAGTRALGTVVAVEQGGKFKERARLGIRFHTLVLNDGTRVPISTETIYRFGNAPGNASAARIGGGAVIGAIVGGIVGGGKGAAIGATAGAGAGTASVMATDPNPAVFPSGAELTARILSPVTITIERE